MFRKALFLFYLIVLSGCAHIKMIGSVDPEVINYSLLTQKNPHKTVTYKCDFDKIARQDFKNYGDYCGKPGNEDYVSYITSFDVQSTNRFRVYLAASSSLPSKDEESYTEYFKIYAANEKNFNEKNFNPVPPTSFAVKLTESSYVLGLTKKDLLPRINIKPVLSVISLKPVQEAKSIDDYEILYSVMPYNFEATYTSAQTGRILGTIAYMNFMPLDENGVKLLNSYNFDLNEFWSKPASYKSSDSSIGIIDYALVQVGSPKFAKGLTGKYPLDFPMGSEGIMSDYLPEYELQSISVATGDGTVKRFNQNDILKTVLSLDDDSILLYKYSTNKDVKLIYEYKAKPPRKVYKPGFFTQDTGIGYIYSDLGNTITVEMEISNYYSLENLPANCIDKTVLNEYNATNDNLLHKFIAAMPVYEKTVCTYNQKSISSYLLNFFQ